MKNIKNTIIIAVLALSQQACSSDDYIDPELSVQLQGLAFSETEEGSPDRIIWLADDMLEEEKVRQVGREGDNSVPYPTVCHYIETSKITNLRERSTAERKQSLDFATHVMGYTVLRAELVEDDGNDEGCEEFVARQNSSAPSYSTYFEILSENEIRLHNSGGGDYKQGGDRTESTLDEVFRRN